MNNEALPYGGSSGWSGSEASRERAESNDKDGTTARRQREVMDAISEAGIEGITWCELSDKTGGHHGTVSGCLSVLHKTGRIERLKEKRNRSHIYVLPAHIDGREVSKYMPNKNQQEIERLRTLGDMLARTVQWALQEREIPEDVSDLLFSWEEARRG